MALESCAALIRAIKARTIYAPDGNPAPSDYTPRLRNQWLQMAAEYGIQSERIDPKRDDFGFTTIDEAPAWLKSGNIRIGLHIIDMRSLGLTPSGIIREQVTLGVMDPVSIGYFIDRRPDWDHPSQWIQSLLEQDNVYDLTRMHPDNPVSRRHREDFQRKMIGYGLL